MLKKLIVVGSGVTMLSALFFGRDAVSYVTTSAFRVQESIQQAVPIEFEIDRARKMIADLDPEIRRNLHMIAREEVEIDHLTRRLVSLEGKIEKGRSDLARLGADIRSGRTEFQYAGLTYSRDRVQHDAESRLVKTKTMTNTRDKLNQVLRAREQSLLAAQNKMAEMRSAQSQLEIDVENYQARKKTVDVAKAASLYKFDDSQLARTRELLDRIATRISVEEKLVDTDVDITSEIQLDEPAEGTNVSERIAAFLGSSDDTVATIVSLEQ